MSFPFPLISLPFKKAHAWLEFWQLLSTLMQRTEPWIGKRIEVSERNILNEHWRHTFPLKWAKRTRNTMNASSGEKFSNFSRRKKWWRFLCVYKETFVCRKYKKPQLKKLVWISIGSLKYFENILATFKILVIKEIFDIDY